ncbi:MAG: response regulator [Anaerolineae bacterium]|nr:response regulator [Anaerolineae bacterium]
MSKKVLIIEDRRENIVFIANNILRPKGYEVITARDGQTGLEKAQAEQPDLIITDLKLPQLGGLEVLEQLNEKGYNIPAIVMTFHGTEETAKQALRLGAKDYLIKPFTIEEMYEAIDRALKSVTSPLPQPEDSPDKAETAQLGQELSRLKGILATRERQLEQMGKQLANSIGKTEVAEIAQRAAAWEEDYARLNSVLAQTKDALAKTDGQAQALAEAVMVQKKQLGKYQQEMKRMAHELHNLSEAMRLMAQDMEHQIERLDVLIPRQKES